MARGRTLAAGDSPPTMIVRPFACSIALTVLALVGLSACSDEVADDVPASTPVESTTSTTSLTAPGQREEYGLSPLVPAFDEGPVVAVPPGCTPPLQTVAVIDAEAEIVAEEYVRFRVERVLDGSIDGYAIGARLDIYYGLDTVFIETGTTYVVGVVVHPEVGRLSSKVRPDKPMFGGDAVIGADDTDLDCPVNDDPAVTLSSDGRSLDSGLLVPLQGSGRRLANAVLRPAAIASAILLGLVLVKHLLFALAASIRDAGTRPALHRRR